MKSKETNKWSCDFCGRSQEDVETIIAGPGEIAICNRCVFRSNEIILQQLRTMQIVKPINAGVTNE